MPNSNTANANLQSLFSDSDFISLSPSARRETLRQIVPELRNAADETVDSFASAYGGKNFQQMTDKSATPGNMQSKPGGPVTNAYGITGPFAPRPGETPQDAFMRVIREQAGIGEQRNDLGNKVIVPIEGESFASTIDRAVEYGKQVTPQQIQQQTASGLRKAPLALAAGPVMAAAQLAIPAAAAALSAPTAAGTSAEGTGILDAAGNEIMREVSQAGSSLGKQALQTTLSWVGRHKLLSAVAYEGARRAGIPLPNVIGWLSRAASEAK